MIAAAKDGPSSPMLSVSIVSHGQMTLVMALLDDIRRHCSGEMPELILTLNIPEEQPFSEQDYPFPLRIIRNPSPQGFGENHNQAFRHARGRFFCVLNPDIRIQSDVFLPLIDVLNQVPHAGLVAPLVCNPDGAVEDSARHFPTPFKILCKFFGGCKGGDYAIGESLVYPEWVGGMFMLFPRKIFEQLGGFDQRFFLYYEDVDLCARLRLRGYEIVLCPAVKVIHDAHRSSHRSVKFLKWHIASMLRFFLSYTYWRVQCRKWL